MSPHKVDLEVDGLKIKIAIGMQETSENPTIVASATWLF